MKAIVIFIIIWQVAGMRWHTAAAQGTASFYDIQPAWIQLLVQKDGTTRLVQQGGTFGIRANGPFAVEGIVRMDWERVGGGNPPISFTDWALGIIRPLVRIELVKRKILIEDYKLHIENNQTPTWYNSPAKYLQWNGTDLDAIFMLTVTGFANVGQNIEETLKKLQPGEYQLRYEVTLTAP